MQAKPNKTILRGRVKSIEPHALGAEIELEVSQNSSPDPEEDFLRCEPGTTLKAYFADVEQNPLSIGDEVQAQASLAADAFGGKAIFESVSQIKKTEKTAKKK
ncbi:MAG TPA: hypothetical protein VF648_11705 [Pyrinomonadaceae bacterium]|jgi:hypothetical protein